MLSVMKGVRSRSTSADEQNMQVRIGRRILIHRQKLEKWINDQVK